MSELANNGYQLVKQFIDIPRAQKLSDSFQDFCNTQNLGGDVQVPASKAYYNYIKFAQLLVEKIPHVNSLLGEPVLPTYAYSRWYTHGNSLAKHTDRDECEVSITLNLSCDIAWPIFLLPLNKQTVAFALEPGDALIYFGTAVPHWRDKFAGELCVQAFLHYVRSRGKNSHLIFDNYRHRKLLREHFNDNS